MKHILIAISVLALGACGGGGGSDTLDTGIDGTKKLGDLTAAEAKTACEAVENFLDSLIPDKDLIEAFCSAEGVVVEALDQGTCEAARDACLADTVIGDIIDDDEDDEGENDEDCVDVAADIADCDVTVAELEACFSAAGSVIADFVSGVSCSSSTDDIEEDLDLDFDIPECEKVAELCPNIVE